MRVLFECGQEQTKISFQSNVLLIIPDLFSDKPNIYTELLEEIFRGCIHCIHCIHIIKYEYLLLLLLLLLVLDISYIFKKYY